MRINASSNLPEFQKMLLASMQFYRTDLPTELRKQSRLLGQRLIQFTPPNTRAQGRAAVQRDIHRAVRPLRRQDFKSKKLQKLLRERSYSGLQIVFDKLKTGDLRGAQVKPFSPDLHQRARDRRGRVTRWRKVVTPDVEDVKAYIERVQANVGEAKGGWANLVTRLGGSVAQWIEVHSDAGQFEDKAGDLVNAYIRIDNNSEWAGAGDEDRVVANAIRSRTRDMALALQIAQQKALRKGGFK